jgi:hypothetical protein
MSSACRRPDGNDTPTQFNPVLLLLVHTQQVARLSRLIVHASFLTPHTPETYITPSATAATSIQYYT